MSEDQMSIDDDIEYRPTLIRGGVEVVAEGSTIKYIRHDGSGGPGVEMAFQKGGELTILPKEGADVGSRSAYAQLRTIVLDDMEHVTYVENDYGPQLEGLPDGVGKYFRYGLTFPRSYKSIVRQVEQCTDCSTLHISSTADVVTIEGDSLVVPRKRFDELIAEIDIHRSRASSIVARIREQSSLNLVNEALGIPPVDPSRGRLPIVQAMTDAVQGNCELSEGEESDILDLVASQADSAVKRQPGKFAKLRNDIEAVSLEALIDNFDAGISDPKKASSEGYWQEFFELNGFALQQIFGAPVDRVATKQLQVQAAGSDGRGARIADFVLRNPISGDGMLVEIKTPATALLRKKPYRGEGDSAVYPPSDELSGAVAQLQSQRHSLQHKLSTKLPRRDPLNSIEAASRYGAVIVGSLSGLEDVQLESLKWYREGLSDVVVLGFDEVLERLRALLYLLKDEGPLG